MINLVEAHYKENFNTLCKKMRRFSDSDGEDIVQESYLRAIKYLPSFNEKKDFNKWFNTIMYNTLKDFKGQRDGIVVDLDPDYLMTPYDRSEAMYGRLIHKFTEKSRPDHKEIIYLHYVYGYRPIEINQVVDHSLSNINSIIHNFRQRIKESMK